MRPISASAGAKLAGLTVLAAHLAIVPMTMLTKVSIDLASFAQVYLFFLLFAAAACYMHWRAMHLFKHALLASLFGLMLAIPVLVSTYAAISLDMPLADQRLIAMDNAIGFDWLRFIEYVDRQAWLARILQHSYESFALQLLVLPALLVVIGKSERGYGLVVAYAVLCFLSSFISVWFPALGAYPTFQLSAAAMQNIDAHFGYFFVDQFNAVRDHGAFTISLGSAAGIITFPSVHAGVALVCSWAAWGSIWLRLPFLLLNIFMALSAISHGSHYLVDIVAGVAVAILAIAITSLVIFRRGTANQSAVGTYVNSQPRPSSPAAASD
ncbi:MAG: hypothetical protein Rhirs2KO_22330 [Rhizobiaceae bacterium]